MDDEDYYGAAGAEVDGYRKPVHHAQVHVPENQGRRPAFADIDAENMEQSRFFDSEEPGQDEWWIASGAQLVDQRRRHHLHHSLLRA